MTSKKVEPPVTPDGQQASVAALEAAAKAKATFDWATLPVAVPMPNKQVVTAIKVDVLASVPEPIRQRMEASLTINTERVKAKTTTAAKRPRVDYHWELQPVTNEEMGAAFVKLATKYAKYRPADKDIPHIGPTSPKGQITVRAGAPNHYRKLTDGTYEQCDKSTEGAFYGVRYSARPFEQRQDAKALPGTS
jgi:hypothetical protein